MRSFCILLSFAVAAAFNLSMVSCGWKSGSGAFAHPQLLTSRLRGGGALNSVAPEAKPGPGGQICHLLVDMDSVIVDWDGAFKARWLEKHPEDEELIRNRKEFEFEKNFPPEKQEEIIEVMTSPGYYYSMQPMPGVIEALKEIVSEGYDVRICTAPDLRCAPSCAAEKFQWVKDYLGDDWMGRLIITRDKTHVKGKLLVDDKPHVTGSGIPSWKHVVFDAPYNQGETEKNRLSSWSEWRSTLEEFMKSDGKGGKCWRAQ